MVARTDPRNRRRTNTWRLPVALVAGLIASVIGTAALVAAVLLPPPLFPGANQVATPPLAARQDGPGRAAADPGSGKRLRRLALLPENCALFAGADEPMSGSTEPVDEQDPRAALLAMAAAQRTGRVTVSCPCPMGVPSDLASPNRSDDRLANALFPADVPPVVVATPTQRSGHPG